ncbi:MAG: dTDP-4-dehydrorhamnose reductase [Deltaproteobacteria bacterium]|nr:dTDP-4-dehydrorhamnose reductase [Deltaproteobacteria bacterium]MBW2075524.1 dTDP-4-dehydrorhamnose reductase [Deltaproteobacteria bacterium]
MRILLLGKNGQLGWELCRTLATLGDVVALGFSQIDLTQDGAVRQVMRQMQPQIIVNAAAYTAVDQAENEPDKALAVNGDAPGIMAEEAKALSAAFVHYSTDYVFDGKKGEPYCETDMPNPLNVYGQTKLAGEQVIDQVGGAYLILRTSWVYSLRRDSFVTQVLRWARQQPTLRIVTDQVSNPTWCRMLAEATAQVLAMGGEDVVPWLAEYRGMYHLAGDGYTSRLEWAREILKYDPRQEEQVVQHVQPALTAEFPSPAQRPRFSSLNCDRFFETFGIRLPDWKYALHMAMETF